MRRVSVLIGFFLCLVACAPPGVPVADPNYDAHGKRFEPPAAGMAALYIANVDRLNGTPPLNVSIGSRQLGSLPKNSWFRVELAPGNYDVRATGSGGSGWHYERVGPGDMRFVIVQYAGPSLAGEVFDVPAEQGRQVVLAGRRAWESQ